MPALQHHHGSFRCRTICGSSNQSAKKNRRVDQTYGGLIENHNFWLAIEWRNSTSRWITLFMNSFEMGLQHRKICVWSLVRSDHAELWEIPWYLHSVRNRSFLPIFPDEDYVHVQVDFGRCLLTDSGLPEMQGGVQGGCHQMSPLYLRLGKEEITIRYCIRWWQFSKLLNSF